MADPRDFELLGRKTPCSFCGAKEGERCRTTNGLPATIHKPRRVFAFHVMRETK